MMRKVFFAVFCFTLPLAAELNVLAFAGSTRDESINKKLVKEAALIAEEMGAKVTLVDLRDFSMPFYDGDLEKSSGLPVNARKLKALLLASDAVIIASPEYNASLPAVLKNAIDWTSRREGDEKGHVAFNGKRFALMSASPGRLGGARALAHLKSVIEDVGGTVVESRVSIPRAPSAFNEKGELSEDFRALLKNEVAELFLN